MIDFLKSYWESLKGEVVIKTSDLIVSMVQSREVFMANVGDELSQLQIMLSEAKDDKSIIKVFNTLGFKEKNIKSLIARLNRDYDLLVTTTDGLIKIMEAELPSMLTQNTLTIKQAALLEYHERLLLLMMTLPKLFLYVTYKITDSKVLMYKKGYVKTLALSPAYHAEILSLDKNHKAILKDLSSLSDTRLNADREDINAVASKLDKTLPIRQNNFITTWIYVLGKWKVDFDLTRLEIAKEEKKLFELKIIELKEREQSGNVSTSISKQIEYYENKLVKLNRKIEQLASEY